VTLGLAVPQWAKTAYPEIPAVGRFDGKIFDPEEWKPNYPNRAFLNRLPGDTFWAAKQVMAFTDDEVRALVATGEFTDHRAVEWITRALIERRNKIGRAYLSSLLPLDGFVVAGNRLEVRDLAVEHDLAGPRRYAVRWFYFDNVSRRRSQLAGGSSLALPAEVLNAKSGSYFAAEIQAEDPIKTVTAYLRRDGRSVQVVGIERTWSDGSAVFSSP
jgi:hypothetical protein